MMKISMWMLHDALGEAVSEHNLGESSQLREVTGVLPYLTGEDLTVDNVYIVRENDLNPRVFTEEFCLILCGGGDTELPRLACRYIRLNSGITAGMALTLAINAFGMYNDWYDRLRSELIESPDLTRICKIGNELIHNYITLFDPNLILLAYYALPPWMFNLILVKKRGPYYALSEDAFKAMISNPLHKDDANTKRAVYTTDPTLGLRVLYVNVGTGEFDCRLCVGENERQFRESDGQLCEILADVLFTALKHNYLSSSDTKTNFRDLLCAMLTGQSVDERVLDKVLSVWQWERGDKLLCLRVEKQIPDSYFKQQDRYICSRLEELLEDACSFVLDGYIVCVARLIDEETPSDAVNRLTEFFRGSGFILGASSGFVDITHVKRYYEEAVIAVRIGRAIHPDNWYYMFRDYAILYFFKQGTAQLPAIHFCDDDIRLLLEYRGAKVDYYETLRIYLENDRNLLNTAKTLQIHRTTLFYRLNRISEIINGDLDDVTVRKRMMFSIALIEMENSPEEFISKR